MCDGGGNSQPTTQTQKQDLPDWAIPYAQKVLGKGEALSNAPYQAYQGERQAQFTPLQQQAFAGAGNMAPSAAGADVTQRALNTSYSGYQPGQFGAQANQYMDPYMQNVVNIQQREAQRQADIAGTQRNAQATQAGAFGGSRQAIMDAEAARNLATQKGDIQARGLQDAYGRAQTQFNTEQQLAEQSRQYGAGLGMQGLQTALQGAGQGFQQGMDINRLQSGYGTQQQQQVQAGLAQQYEDFLAQKKFPYSQLEFQSNLLRGTPSGSTQSIYAPVNPMSQVLGAGTSLAGAYMMGGGKFAEGGEVTPGSGLMDLALSKL